MDDFFTSDEYHQSSQPIPVIAQQETDHFDFSDTNNQPAFNAQPQEYAFQVYNSDLQQAEAGNGQAEENDFNDYEEDEATKRIREEEERIQNSLREKSEREWQDKQARRAEGRRQLQEFLSRKEQEKVERAAENIRKQAINKQELAKLNVEANWRKVIMNINVRAGEHKGKKDTNRMREAILHRREDDKR